MATFAQQIKALREERKLTQKEFADMIGTSSKSVMMYESGKTIPRKKMQEKIEEVFDVKLVIDQEEAAPAKEKAAVEEKKAPTKAKEEKKAPAKAKEEKKAPAKAKEEKKAPAKKAEDKKTPAKTAETKKAPAKAAEEKKAPANTTEVKIAEPAQKKGPGRPKKTDAAKAPVVKKEAKAPVKEETKAAKKEETKLPEKKAEKASPKKTARGAAKKVGKKVPGMTIQSLMGGSITIEQVLKKVHKEAPGATEVYIKPEENKAYWVSKRKTGSVDLW